MKESDVVKWLTFVLVFMTVYQCHELRELRDDLDRVDVNAVDAHTRLNRLSGELEALEYELRRRR